MSKRRKKDPRTGVERIVDERARQITLGWTPEHDEEHDTSEMAMAAACYVAAATSTRIYTQHTFAAGTQFSDPFPWNNDARPFDGNMLRAATDAEAIRLLEKAGALIAAEIDRRLRKKARATEARTVQKKRIRS